MSDDPLVRIQDALTDIAARMVTSDDLTALCREMDQTRSEIMARIDRLQDVMTLQHEELLAVAGPVDRRLVK
jgi:hypothetical protein